MMEHWQLGFFILFCISVFLSDLLFRRVQNVVIIIGMAVQVSLVFYMPHTRTNLAGSWETAITGLIVGFVFLLPFYVFRTMGAGDVKFFAVVGFFLGPLGLLPVWIIGSLLAGIHALAVTAFKGYGYTLLPIMALGRQVSLFLARQPSYKAAAAYIAAIRGSRRGIPYAAYLAVGAVWFALWKS